MIKRIVFSKDFKEDGWSTFEKWQRENKGARVITIHEDYARVAFSQEMNFFYHVPELIVWYQEAE